MKKQKSINHAIVLIK